MGPGVNNLSRVLKFGNTFKSGEPTWTMATNKMEQAVSDALTYFAVIANETKDPKRSEFARKAGDWVIEASEKLSSYVNTEKHAQCNRERYELAKAAIHSKNPSPGLFSRRHSVEYDKLLENIKEELNEPAKLAADVNSLYEKQDDLMMELAGIELISDEAGEAIGDQQHVMQVLRHISTVNYTLINGAQLAFVNEVSRHTMEGYADEAFAKSAMDYANRFNEASMASVAAFSATTEVLASGKRVTKKEFLDIREKYGSELRDKIGSVVSQIETLMKNPSMVPGEQPEYEGNMFG